MHERILDVGRNCWRVARSDRVAFLIDGEAYFAAFCAAAERAQRSILIVGWDVDSRAMLFHDGDSGGLPATLGDFLDALVKRRKTLQIHVVNWDFAMLYALEREFLPIYALGWRTHARMHFHLDDVHPLGASHHQKIVVVDDAVAFVGGLDLTIRRWDTSEHRPDEPRRVDPAGNPYPPFHDVEMLVDGAAAAALGEVARERWRRATGEKLRKVRQRNEHDPWPENVVPDVTAVDVAIVRTEPRYEGRHEVQEVKQLYLDAIAAARQSIYLENQYFTSAAVGDALAVRLAEPDGPEIVVVSRLRGGGWLEQNTMEVLRARLVRRLRDLDRHDRLRIYCPEHSGLGEQCVDLHSKLMIVDDRLLRIGSANLANRSMGLDTECDLAIEAAEPHAARAIVALRNRLLGEHLGVAPSEFGRAFEEKGSLIEAIEALRGNSRSLVPLGAALDPDLDRLVPDAAMIDPERPVDPEALIDEFVPPEEQPHAGRRLIFLALLLAGIAALVLSWRWGPLAGWLDPEALAHAASRVRDSSLAPFWILGAYVIASIIALPISLLIVATALVFGPFAAFAYALCGAIAGAAVGFGIGHVLGRQTIRRVAGARLNRLSRRLGRSGVLAVLAVRVIPVAPFTVVNFVAGASHIRLRDFLIGTTLGMAPGIAGVSIFSDRLLAALRDPSPGTIASLSLIAAVIFAGAIGIRWWFTRRGDLHGEQRP